jgi:hypothetical protein
MVIKEGYCFNPSSNRICRLDTAKTKKLIKSGIIVLPRDLQMPNERIPETPIQEPEPPKPEVQEQELKKEVKAELKTIINENKNEFKELTQKETDKLLRVMLYEKLVLSKPKKEKKIVKTKPKTKKYKLRKIESSSESESESESESD